MLKLPTRQIILFTFVLLAFSACGQPSFEQKLESLYRNTVTLIKSEDLDELLKKEQVYVLDTRAPEEFKVSHLPGARFVNYDDFEMESLSDIPKDAKVIVYCSVGYRSERIGEKLQQKGYKDVSNLYGGIFGWKNQGHTVHNNKNQPTDSVHTYNENWSQWLKKGIKVYE